MTNFKPTDTTRVILGDKSSVAHWTSVLKVSKAELAALVELWGNSGAVIRRELRR
jgi:hypothetical protein